MRVVVQRVSQATVASPQETRSIGKGFAVLVAATHTDTSQDAEYLANKIVNLRVMADSEGKMNRTLKESNGELLVVSQFTLYARTRKGNRPSFVDAAEPKKAEALYEEFVRQLRGAGLSVETGRFGKYMQLTLVGDGPVTIIIDSQERRSPRKGSDPLTFSTQ